MPRSPKGSLFGGGKKDIQAGFDAAKRSAVEERARKASMAPASPSDPKLRQRSKQAADQTSVLASDSKLQTTSAAAKSTPPRKPRAESRAKLDQASVPPRKPRAESRAKPDQSSAPPRKPRAESRIRPDQKPTPPRKPRAESRAKLDQGSASPRKPRTESRATLDQSSAPPRKPRVESRVKPEQKSAPPRKSRAESRATSDQKPSARKKGLIEHAPKPNLASQQEQVAKEPRPIEEVKAKPVLKPEAKDQSRSKPSPEKKADSEVKPSPKPEPELTLVPDLTPSVNPKPMVKPVSKPVHLPVLTQKDIVRLRHGPDEHEEPSTSAFEQDEIELLKQRQEEHERLNPVDETISAKEKAGKIKLFEEAAKHNQQKIAEATKLTGIATVTAEAVSKLRSVHPAVKITASVFFALVLVVASLGAALAVVAFPATNAELIAHAHAGFPAEEVEARQVIAAEILRYVTTLPFEPVTEISMSQDDLDILRQWSLGEYELCHLTDVRILLGSSLLLAYVLMLISVVVVTITRNTSFAKRSLFIAGLTSLIIPIVLGLSLIFFFQSTFVLFHEIFFPQGNWQFAPDTLLISTLPERYWQAAGLLWMILFMVNGLILTALSRFCGKTPTQGVTND